MKLDYIAYCVRGAVTHSDKVDRIMGEAARAGLYDVRRFTVAEREHIRRLLDAARRAREAMQRVVDEDDRMAGLE
ncbi:unnamed protein product [Tilletia controversa]|nr:hypothetical protein CF328_g6039 [Tilletia controversa]CAD6897147.1 unnamed protein product [Tilletia controversa]CAD6907374.1 unnamed protein product [Tilletia controversa]CAD6968044.1 unnamed protein product [Tilletia controversa]CAD6977854.1 unnamed protein product [Tilletia controversa]